MHLSYLDLTVIVLFLALTMSIGIYFRKAAGKGMESFFLGGRNLPWYIAGTSMVATTFAADTPLAVTEIVATDGVAGNWLWWNALIGGMLTTFFFAKLWRCANITTDNELIELRYSGKPAAFLRGFRAIYLGLFMNALIIGWVNVALMTLLKVFFNIPDEYLIYYVGAAMLMVVIYSSLSGLLGVAYTDVLQFVIAMGGCIVLAVLVLDGEAIGGVEGLKAQLPEGTLDFFPKIGADTGLGETLALGVGSFVAFLGVQWWASWYPGAEPGGGGYVAQRMMSAKDERNSIMATLFFQITHYCIRPWPWIIVGLCAIVLYPELDDKRLGYAMAMRDYLPDGLRGLLLVAFFAAYMSTVSTQLNWGASYLINDVYKRFIAPNAEDKAFVMVSRITTVLLMIFALFATTQINSIAGVWRFIFECGVGLGLVLILRWYWWRINAWSEIAASLAPFLFYAIAKFALNMEFPDSFFLTVGGTTVVWLAVTYMTPATPMAKLQDFYTRVRPQGAWGPLESVTVDHGKLWPLFVCWGASVVMAYASLFTLGKAIFLEWGYVGIGLMIALVSGFLLNFIANRYGIFK